MTLPTPPAIPHHWAKGLSFALAAVLATVLLIRLVMTFRYTPVFCDSGYYLTVGRLMSEGARLYSDIRFAYPPVYPLILSWLTPIAPHHYAFWTGLHLLLTAATAWMVYRIARLCAIRHSFALLAAWLYLMGALLAGAGQVFLETPSCLAGMGALLLLAKHPQKSWWTLLAGLLAGLAACTKQYGIGFAPVCLLWIALLGTGSWKNRLQGGLLFVLGMGLCLATVGLVFPETLSLFQLHDAYGTDQKAAVLYRKMGGLRFIPKRLGYLTFRCMPLLLCLIPPLGRISRTRLRLLLPLACGFFGFTGQFYFSNGWHYLLYIFPFAALLSALALQDFAERGPWTRLLLTAVLLFSVGSLSAQALDPGAFRKKKKQYRIERHVAKMLQQVPPEAVLLPYNAELYGQYWISGLQPPKVNGQYCLSFGPLALNESLMNQKIAHSQYLVKYKRSSHWEYKPHASTEALLQACDTVSHDAGFCLLCNPNFTE